MTTAQKPSRARAPLSDVIAIAVSKLVDDSLLAEKREPSHSEIEFQISKAGLAEGDPNLRGQTVGKMKRMRGVLYWAMEHDPESGEEFVAALVALIRGCGGFRSDSPNYVGAEAIRTVTDAFKAEGYVLSEDGDLRAASLDGLSGKGLTEALKSYVRRAQRGVTDAALVVGTGKDLLEATAAHVLTERFGAYRTQDNFPTLLGQAFVALGLSTSEDRNHSGDGARKRFERALYNLGCSVNALRNKEGIGHGRPWLTGLSDGDARLAAESIAIVAAYLLNALELQAESRS